MKRTTLLVFIMFTVISISFGQGVTDADFISHMHNELAAVKKGSQWAFIDAQGKIVINFRDDLIITSTKDGSYPIFENDRCLISQKKDGINYYGYIDTSGKTVIEPQYLNATNFNNKSAIVLLLKRTERSANTALNKPVVSYDYYEAVIDTNGKTVMYLNEEPTHITLSASNLKKPPVIHSKFISNTIVAVMNSQKKWSIINLQKD